MKFDLYELEKLQQTLLSPHVTVSLVRVQQIAFRCCFRHCPPIKFSVHVSASQNCSHSPPFNFRTILHKSVQVCLHPVLGQLQE